MFDHIRSDWKNCDGDLTRQALWVMLVYRLGRWCYNIPTRILRLPFSILYKILKLASQIMAGIDLPCETRVGARFTIEHFGDIIISGDAQFGDDCRIRNGVTVGLKRTSERGSPVIGNRVDIGTGAKVLGAITVGDDVAIGANAVVTKDVPANSVAVGVPAVVKPRVSPAESDTISTPSASADV